jgi:anti-sigma B factor antagonist
VDLSVKVEDLDGPGEGWTLARVGGELDVATAPRLREQLLAAIAEGGPRLVVDLGDVDFLDSTGLGVIVGVLKRARTLGGDLRLVCPSPAIRRVFEITALDRTMPLADTVDDALSGVAER